MFLPKVVAIGNGIVFTLTSSSVTPGGIVIPDTVVDPSRKAIVYSVGPEAGKLGIEPGMEIILHAHALPPRKLELPDEGTYYFTDAAQIAGCLKHDPEPFLA